MPTPFVSLAMSPLKDVVQDYQMYYQRIMDLSLQQTSACQSFVIGQIPIINGRVRGITLSPTSTMPTQYAAHPHQYNVSKVQKKAAQTIMQNAILNAPIFSDFEQLFDWICSILVGPKSPFMQVNLTIYDIALRYGFSLPNKILPEKYVYLLGNGPRNGYKTYCKRYNGGKIPYKKKGYLIPTSFFSGMKQHFSRVTFPLSMYVEDILCLY